MSIDEKVKKVFFALLKNALVGEKISLDIKNLITDGLLEELFKLAKRQDLAHLVCDALEKNDIKVCDKLLSKFKNEKNVAIFRSNQVDYELAQISKALEEEKIDFILLKGAIIRNLYPEKWMRTSCDIDVLIKEEDIERAGKVLKQKLEYKHKGNTAHDIQFLSESGLAVELHFSMLKDDSESSRILDGVWENLEISSSSEKVLTNEFLYFYHISHMATHFKQGGCGIRNFIDLYLIEKNLNVDKQVLNNLLGNAGLIKFAKAVLSVSVYIFENTKENEIVSSILDFVLGAGIYGSIENKTAINQAKKGGKFKYIISRIFPSYGQLKYQYSKLNGNAILYPFYVVRRWFRLLNKKSRKTALYEYKKLSKDDEKKATVERLFKELEI